MARPLCSTGSGCRGRLPSLEARPAPQAGGARASTSLADLAEEGPYFVVAALLGAEALCAADASCRLLLALNRAHVGPWRDVGARAFRGLELEREGVFEQGEGAPGAGRKLARIDWKGRFRRFRADVPSFCPPFGGPEIVSVAHPDEVAYFRCRLCTDVLGDAGGTAGAYLEVEVLANPDNLSMAVVDFEAGGCSSVTFSPDTGAVIRERKVREAPRKVEGAYIQPLPTVPPGRRFHGRMGLLLKSGRLAFFRKSAAEDGASEEPPWETTGFVSDLKWAEGRRLTPCIAFRDEGAYRVRVVRVGAAADLAPLVPLPAGGAGAAEQERGSTRGGWSGFDWEVGPPALAGEEVQRARADEQRE